MIRKDLIKAGEAILSGTGQHFGSRSRSFALNQTLDNTHLQSIDGEAIEEQNSQEQGENPVDQEAADAVDPLQEGTPKDVDDQFSRAG